MLTIKRKAPKRIAASDTAYEFDFLKYHDEAIADIITRFKKTANNKQLNSRFESDFVFKESDAITVVEACFRMNLPFEVSYELCYDGCWEINFKALLEKRKAG